MGRTERYITETEESPTKQSINKVALNSLAFRFTKKINVEDQTVQDVWKVARAHQWRTLDCSIEGGKKKRVQKVRLFRHLWKGDRADPCRKSDC